MPALTRETVTKVFPSFSVVGASIESTGKDGGEDSSLLLWTAGVDRKPSGVVTVENFVAQVCVGVAPAGEVGPGLSAVLAAEESEIG